MFSIFRFFKSAKQGACFLVSLLALTASAAADPDHHPDGVAEDGTEVIEEEPNGPIDFSQVRQRHRTFPT